MAYQYFVHYASQTRPIQADIFILTNVCACNELCAEFGWEMHACSSHKPLASFNVCGWLQVKLIMQVS
jgi:hypothetical protein